MITGRLWTAGDPWGTGCRSCEERDPTAVPPISRAHRGGGADTHPSVGLGR